MNQSSGIFLSRLGLTRNSIGRAALAAVGWRISMLLIIVSFAGYYYLQRSLENRLIDRLEIATTASADKESELFRDIKQAHEQSEKLLRQMLAAPGENPITFEDLFNAQQDGSFRSKDALFDGLHLSGNRYIDGTGAIIPSTIQLDQERERLLANALLVSVQMGQAYYPEVLSYYFFTPDSAVLIRAPSREDNLNFYRKNAPHDFDISSRGLARVTSVEQNPEREFRCTTLRPLLSDVFGNSWTTGCHLPIDIDGEHVGSFGSSVRLNKLLASGRQTKFDGGDTMIISSDGKLIMHSRLTKDGEIDEQMLDIQAAGNQDVRSIYADMLENLPATQWVSFLPELDAYVAAAKIDHLDGYFIFSYPRALIIEEAGAAGLNMLHLGAAALIIALLTLILTLRKTVTAPLNRLIKRTEQLALGQFKASDIKDPSDVTSEIDALAKSTEKMAGEIATMVGSLEIKVAERTEALEAARDEAERANAAKTDFLANMSHEIRTPLTGIIGMLELLSEQELTKEAKNNLMLAQKSSGLLLALVNDILDISRLEAGKFSLHMSALDIREALQETAESLRLLANQKSLDLTFLDHFQEALWVEIDLKVTRQILINLVGNAIKFTEEGSVTIEFNAREIDDTTVCLQLDVVDTGVGMTQEESARVFDRFEQSGPSLTGEQIGAGLGLAIVKDLVTLLGGDITCLTAKGRGSRFTVSFPVTRLENPPQPLSTDNKIRVNERPLRGLSIIAVDDNAINRIIIGKTCETLGAKIELFETGDDMIAHLSQENAPRYDVMLLDLNMPEKDGFETLGAIRSLSNTAATLPAIALTADAIDGTEAKVKTAGMEGYVTKPINASELAEAILLLAGPHEEALQ